MAAFSKGADGAGLWRKLKDKDRERKEGPEAPESTVHTVPAPSEGNERSWKTGKNTGPASVGTLSCKVFLQLVRTSPPP